MRDTISSIITKIMVLMIIACLMFGEYVVLRIHFAGSTAVGNAESPASAVTEPALPSENAQSLPSLIEAGSNNVIADMVERVESGIVNIETQVVTRPPENPFFNDPFFNELFGDPFGWGDQEYVQNGLGTGFIINEDGYIITNQHVIEEATEISVLVDGSSEPCPAVVIGEDRDLDLAIIKIDATVPLTPLTLGDSSDIRVGELVTAIGNPYGLDHTVTVGVISATGRPITIEDRTYEELIQTDAAINPGNSGGPLLNLEGEVVGINTAVSVQAQGIGFAISINTAKEVLDQLITEGRVIRPFIGINMQDMDEDAAAFLGGIEPTGVAVVRVVQGSPAERAGVQVYDVIVGMDDTVIENTTQLQDYMETRKVGEEIILHIIREQEEITLTVTLGEKP